MKDIKRILLNFLCLLFFVVFAVAVFILVSILTPDKPAFFDTISIENIEGGGLS